MFVLMLGSADFSDIKVPNTQPINPGMAAVESTEATRAHSAANTGDSSGSPRAVSFGEWVLCWVLLAIVYALTGLLCADISAQVGTVSLMFFIPSGISLTFALLWGRRVWPGVFFGQLLISLISHQAPLTAGLMAMGNGLDAALAGWWFRDKPGRRLEFDRLLDVIKLLVLELLVLQPMSTIFGVSAIAVSQRFSWSDLLTTGGAWYTSNLYAQFVMAPLALVWIKGINWIELRPRWVELAALLVTTLTGGCMGVGRWATYGVPLPVTLVLLFPLMIWAAVRFPSAIAVTAGSVLGLLAFDGCLVGGGPFSAMAHGERLMYLNIFMGVVASSTLFLGAAMGDARRSQNEQAKLIAELRAATIKVKHLEGLVTFCAWTGRVWWNGEWVRVEQFLMERFGVGVSHGISEEAASSLRKQMMGARILDDGPAPAAAGEIAPKENTGSPPSES